MAVFCRFLWYDDPNRISLVPPHTSTLMVYLMVSSRSPDRRYHHGFDRNRHQERQEPRQILQTHRRRRAVFARFAHWCALLADELPSSRLAEDAVLLCLSRY